MTDQVEDQEVMEDEVNEAELAIQTAFDEAIANESDEDAVKMAMIGAGASFKNVTRLYNQFMIGAGLAISKDDRNQIVTDTLEGRDLSEEQGFNDAVEALVEAVQGATERSAAALVRSYAKKNELDVYAKPKGTGTGRVGFASKFYDFLAANPKSTKEEALAFVNGEGDHEDTSENVKKHASHYMGVWGLVNRIVEA